MCSGVSFALAVLTLCASIGGFLFGYDTGVVSGAVVFIEGDLGISSLQVEVVVSVTVGSAALGSLLSGVPMQRYGRRPVIMLASALFAAGSLVIAAAPGFGALLAGRLVLGFGVGVSSMVVPVYIAEAAPPELRGRLVSVFSLCIVLGQARERASAPRPLPSERSLSDGGLGQALACGVNLACEKLLPSDGARWRTSMGVAAAPALLMLAGFVALPESPRWLARARRPDETR